MRHYKTFDHFVMMQWKSILTALFALFVVVVVAGLSLGCRGDYYNPTMPSLNDPVAGTGTVMGTTTTTTTPEGGKRRAVRYPPVYGVWLETEPDWCAYSVGDKVEISYDRYAPTITPNGWFVMKNDDPRATFSDTYVIRTGMDCGLAVFP